MVIFEKPAEVKKLQAELEAFLQEKGRRKNIATHRLCNLLEGAEVY